MASKFQNRMAGTIILVALGVIVLPGMLDGKKKHYQEQFAAIPLVPKPNDHLDENLVPAVTQPLPAKIIQQQAASQIPDESSVNSSTRGSVAPSANSPDLTVQQQAQQERLARQESEKVRKAAQLQAEGQQKLQQRQEATRLAAKRGEEQAASSKPAADTQTTPQKALPSGQAYVIQLGALRNAQRVSEVVAQLRLEGFKAYSLPTTPVQGQINRILVGPDSSKSHLQSQVASLKAKTGLFGVVMPYRVE